MGCAGVERAADLRLLERRQLLRRHGERARRFGRRERGVGQIKEISEICSAALACMSELGRPGCDEVGGRSWVDSEGSGRRLHGGETMSTALPRVDAAGFARVYARHHQALYRYCRSIVRHDQDAQDALQSAMLRAFVALQTERRELELRPWLFRIAHNESISILRAHR